MRLSFVFGIVMTIFCISALLLPCLILYHFPHLVTSEAVTVDISIIIGIDDPVTPVSNLCSQNRHIRGGWIKRTNLTTSSKPIPCCSWDEDSGNNPEQYCHASQFKREGDGFKGPIGTLAFTGGHSCTCKNNQFQDEFEYVASDCEFISWNANLFCQVLGNRTILIIGDSTVGQSASSIMNSIILDYFDTPQEGCQAQVMYQLADTLVGRPMGVLNRGRRWSEIVNDMKPDIVMLSAGPHVAGPISDFSELLDEVLKEHEASFPNVPLIWKSQFPGGCDNSPHWTEMGQTALDYWENYTDKKGRILQYNWPQFVEFDRIAQQKVPGPNRYFMDISPLFLRPDGHVGSQPGPYFHNDCLHFCQPVVDSLVPRVMLQTLLDILG